MRTPSSVKALEDFGRVRLSKTFFMRDFLYSEISQMERIPNLPDEPDLAIETGKKLCGLVLEPIQDKFGRINIRSAFRSQAVNARGNQKQLNCASNEANYAGHIWDKRDANGYMGATACIVVPSFLSYYEKTGDWQALAWWIHDNVEAYSSMCFFPKLAAFNISWHEQPEKRIDSYVKPKGCLTRAGLNNQEGSHEAEYSSFLKSLS